MEKNKDDRYSIKISKKTHKKIKLLSIYGGKSMAEIVEVAVHILFEESELPLKIPETSMKKITKMFNKP